MDYDSLSEEEYEGTCEEDFGRLYIVQGGTTDVFNDALVFSGPVFALFSIIWTGYGVAYLFDEEEKNIAYNILDITSKVIQVILKR